MCSVGSLAVNAHLQCKILFGFLAKNLISLKFYLHTCDISSELNCINVDDV